MNKGMYEYLLENEGRNWWNVGKYACAIRILRKIAVGKPKLLELGSSFGSLSNICDTFTDSFALDYHFDVLKTGKYRRSICGDATKIPVKNERFDIIVALDLLEHLENDSMCIQEVIRVLRPKGKLFLLVPAYPALWSDMDEIANHYRRYTPKTLKGLLSSYPNIKIIKFTHFNSFLFIPILAIRLCQRFLKSIFKTISTESISIPPEPINYILKQIFLFEGLFVYHLNFPLGVSLIAIVEKKA